MIDLARLKRLLSLASDPQIAELEIRQGDFHMKVSLDRSAMSPADGSSSLTPVESQHDPDEECIPLHAHSSSETVIQSPLYGLFHASASPALPPFVSQGTTVSEGDTLAMIESMKMLHAVTAPRAGTITRIMIEDEADVVANQPLFALSAE
ncbi:biotin/lipoyl-containing protein [uncultured Cohaesibacter sp.]|uniref:acetyl-CoA carboxylase biotin carboxyl carrier protein n=1 Tax=uncultured Cohaesibacter sp. TaxID=1002546 RepID=UPI0029C7DC17|nr:biotin/lipoyl-containing protein [uncultured Cohaesibacter sp.]